MSPLPALGGSLDAKWGTPKHGDMEMISSLYITQLPCLGTIVDGDCVTLAGCFVRITVSLSALNKRPISW